MKNGRFIESCCTTLADALAAQKAGADRIELCADLSCGGVTPPLEMIHEAVSALSIPVNVLVRPRAGDFVYLPSEVEEMLDTIAGCKRVGVNGVVIGALDRDGNVDIGTMQCLVAASRPLSITFHRAFDRCSHWHRALEDVISLGCDRLLTSGLASDAMEGRFVIASLVGQASGRIVIMAGCGVRPDNIDLIARDSSADEFHSSRLP